MALVPEENYPNRPARPWDLANPELNNASAELQEKRLDICSTCEHLIKFTHQCKKCGCFMKLKVKLKNASCPIGKWSQE